MNRVYNQIPVKSSLTASVSTKMTAETKYMDVMNGVLLFGAEKFSDTARLIREGVILTQRDISDEERALSSVTPYNYQVNRGLNQKENSISLVNGVRISLDNGFTLDVAANAVDQTGDVRMAGEREETSHIAKAMNQVIKMANGQINGYEFYQDGERNTRFLEIGLKAAGIDTSREFSINDMRFHIKNGVLYRI